MQQHNANRSQILTLLEREGGLSGEAVARVAAATQVAEADIWATARFYGLLRDPKPRTRICAGLSCQVAGSQLLLEQDAAAGEAVEAVSCLGLCNNAPAALDHQLLPTGGDYAEPGLMPDNPDLPINLAGADDAGYQALDAMRQQGAAWMVDELESSGLQGRGGAGFPAHLKWRSVMQPVMQPVIQQQGTDPVLICNADEGEPGTFKDRAVMLRRPHRLLEGIAIAATTVGARDVYIYIRGEYVGPRQRIEQAIVEAGEALAPLRLHLKSGHGAYICGEETALIESIEGNRGLPRLKPPFPTSAGLWGRPTLVHNVETLACLPSIVQRGGAWFRSLGRSEPGTKLYCISGHVQQPGVYELPLGATLDELAAQAGGFAGNPLAFSPGGASSGFLPIAQRGLPLDAKTLASVDSMLGSAGVVVVDDTTDMAEAALIQLAFFETESCGQCAPCRLGSRYLRRQLDAYLASGDPDALGQAGEVGWAMKEGSICGLGMVAAKPFLLAMRYFPEAFGRRAPRSRPASAQQETTA